MKKLFSFLPFLALLALVFADFALGNGALAGMALATVPLVVTEEIKAKAKQLLQAIADNETPESAQKKIEEIGIKPEDLNQVLEFAKSLKDTNVAPNIITKPIGSKKYDSVPTEELAMAYGMMKSASVPIRDEMAQELVGRCESDEFAKTAHREAVKSFGAFRGKVSAKANEISQSTLANAGDEWVSQAWLNSVWERVRLGSNILNDIPTQIIPQGSDSVEIPLESTDLTFYRVPEATDAPSNAQIAPTIPSSKMGTAKKTLNVGKMSARSIYTGELAEDSLIAYAAQLQSQATLAFQEYMESLFLDGDTAAGAATNINHIGGTPSTNDYFLISDGARKNALATAGNNRAGSTLTDADFLATMALLGKNGVDISKLKFLVDSGVYFKSLGLSAVKTVDVFGNDATVRSGELRMIYGVGLQPTAQIAKLGGGLSNSNGKVDLTTPANNTKGQILIVRPDQWRLALKREMRIEYTRFANADASEFVIHTRVGIGARGTTGAAALTYNLSV